MVWVQRRGYQLEAIPIGDAPARLFEVADVPWLAADSSPGSQLSRQELMQYYARGGNPSAPSGSVHLSGVDSRGFVWTWVSLPPDARGRRGGRVEVLDPNAREMLVSKVLPLSFSLIPKTDLAFGYTANPDGIASYTLYRVALKRP